MANGIYGVTRPADISPSDCEILLHYTPSRDKLGDVTLTKLDPAKVLLTNENPNKTTTGSEILGGMYTLKLPTDNFKQKGIYTLIIKPVEIRTRIKDCGVLSAYPNIRGLVVDLTSVDSKYASNFENGNLTGYRIEYLSTDNNATQKKIQNFFRIITSNNRVSSQQTNLNNNNNKSVSYTFNDNASLTFLTVTPSSSPNVKPNALPYIGEAEQDIIITNTFFNPIMIEIEMVEHDIETLAYALLGPQSKSLEDGVYTVYNFDKEIYKQWNLYEIKEEFSGKPLFEIREPKTNVDFNKDFNDISAV